MVFDLRLVAYLPNGAKLGLLPYPSSVNVSIVHNDVGALSLQYSSLLDAGAYLQRGLIQGLEVAVEVWTGSAWTEPWNCRFLLLKRAKDVTDPTKTLSLTLPSYGWMMRKAANLETANLEPAGSAEAGKRAFLNATGGTILDTLMNENAARSGVTITNDFGSSTDSNAAAWTKQLNIYYGYGQNLWTVLLGLSEQGVIDWRTNARVLRAWNPDTACAVDYSTGTAPVRLLFGRDVLDAPDEESLEDMAYRVATEGDNGLRVSQNNTSAPVPWGQWEEFVSQGGVADTATAQALLSRELEKRGRLRGQYTRTLIPQTAQFMPFVNFGPGDWIKAPGFSGAEERLRVMQVTLTRDEQGKVGGNVVLNDRVLDDELRRARQLAGVVGATSANGTGQTPTQTEETDLRQPAAPAGFVVTSSAYFVNGEPWGLVTASWSAVTTATDATAMDINRYELWGRENVTGSPWLLLTTVEGTSANVGNFKPGATWVFQVRARGTYSPTPGAWSASSIHTVAADTTPPATPSTPVPVVQLGTVRLSWDGLDSTGAAMPADFDYCEVHRSTTNGFAGTTSATVVGRLYGKGYFVMPDQPYGTTYYYRLRAVDTSGNASSPSAQASAVTAPLVSTDLANDIIGNAQLADNAVREENILAGTVGVTRLAVGDTSNLAEINEQQVPSVLDTGGGAVHQVETIGTVKWSKRSATTSGDFFFRAQKGPVPFPPGARLRADLEAFADAAVTVTLWVHMYRTDGSYIASNAIGAPMALTTSSQTFALEGDMSAAYVNEAATYLIGLTGAAGRNIRVRNVRVRQMNAGTLVVDGTMYGQKIMVNSLAADRIATGVLNAAARVIAGPELDTHAELSGVGFKAFALTSEGTVYEVLRLGTDTNDRLSITGSNGDSVFNVSEYGIAAAKQLYSAEDVYARGNAILGGLADWQPPSINRQLGHLDKIGRGIIALGSQTVTTYITTARGLMDVAFKAERGRSYAIHCSGGMIKFTAANVTSGLEVRVVNPATVDGVAATPALVNGFQLYPLWDSTPAAGGECYVSGASRILRCNKTGDTSVGGELYAGIVRVGLFIRGDRAGGIAINQGQVDVWVEDVGPDCPETGVPNTASGSTIPVTTPKRTFTSRWRASNSEAYSGAGVARTDTTDLIQGYTAAGGFGDGYSHVLFTGANSEGDEAGVSIATAITGATIVRARLFLYAKHWDLNTGGTAIIYPSTSTALNNAIPGTSGNETQSYQWSGWPKPGSVIVDLTDVWIPSDRSVKLGRSGNTNPEYYGRFAGHLDPAAYQPYVELTYVR